MTLAAHAPADHGMDMVNPAAEEAGPPARYRPTLPSIRSRRKSAWPLCRAYSSIMCTSTSRRTSPRFPTTSRSWCLSNILLRERDLGPPSVPCLGDNAGVGHGASEISVGVGVGPEMPRHVPPGHPQPEPRLLHAGHVAHQPQQRRVGRLYGATGQGGGIQASALELERQALVAQVPGERGALALDPPAVRGSSSGWTNMADQLKRRAGSSLTD